MDPEDIVFEYLDDADGDPEEALALLARDHCEFVAFVDNPELMERAAMMEMARTHDAEQAGVI